MAVLGFIHLILTLARLVGPGSMSSVVVESVLVKHQREANLRILEVTEIKTVPYVPLSHPFVERLSGTIRREFLDHTLFWATADLGNKLLDFRRYFSDHRTHTSLEGQTPDTPVSRPVANLQSHGWQRHCRDLYHTPMAT